MTRDPFRPVVLIVEDDQDTRDMYAMYLSHSGIDVLTASNADEAFRLALAGQPQMVITDHRLAGPVTGLDLCQRLHEEPRTAHMPTLLLTGSTQQATPGGQGCTEVRIKPHLPDALVNDIRDMLSRTV
jgi:DNA-binding response OmpR family regulator